MDEVLRIKKELERTIPKSDTNKALELMRSLESMPMTLDLLQDTHIGLVVNKIRKNADNPEISSLGKSMVKKWKKLLSNASSSSSNNNNNSTTNTTNSSKNTLNETSIQVSPAAQFNQEQTKSAVVSDNERIKRPAPTQTEVPPTTSEVRLKCRQLLTEALKKPLPKDIMQEPFLEEEILAGRIEEAIYQEFRGTDNKYKNRVRSRVSNLGDNKNPYLRLNVLRGDISPEKISRMTAEEMASDELKKQREKFTKEAINDHQMTLTTGTKTSEIKCPACKKYNVTYNQVQTRSADEPMTTFCYCNECGRRWKFC